MQVDDEMSGVTLSTYFISNSPIIYLQKPI